MKGIPILWILLFLATAGVMGIDPYPDLSEANSRFFLAEEGVVLHYQRMGEGSPTIVLLHGFGASVFSWRTVMEELSELGTVIAIDRTGFGLSARPLNLEAYDVNPYSQHAQVRYMMTLVDHTVGQEEPLILIGHSAGAAIAVLAALDHSDRVKRLVLEAPSVLSSRGPSWGSIFADTQLSLSMPIVKAWIGRQFEDLLMSSWYDPSGITPEVVEGYKKALSVPDWEKALQAYTLAQQDIDLASRLGSLNLPVLVISGAEDQIVPLSQSKRTAEMIPGAVLKVISECGHIPHEEHPTRWLEWVKPFASR